MKPILSLAIGLVMVTILGIGLFIHWLIPAITVAAGFALAAILSPTDPVAVSAMTASSPLPSRMAHIEGESLLNDASGLVAFNFAIAAVLTGSFSPGDAVVKFFLMAAGASSVASWWCGSPANVITFWRAPARSQPSDPDQPAYPFRRLCWPRRSMSRDSCRRRRRHCDAL
jgi:CPA1 family monovalent cation:H+ antiporter